MNNYSTVLNLLLFRANNNKIQLDPQTSIAICCASRNVYYSFNARNTWRRLGKQFVINYSVDFNLEQCLLEAEEKGVLKQKVLSLLNLKCCFCSTLTPFWFAILNKRVCESCYCHRDERATLCSKTYAKSNWLITESLLQSLSSFSADRRGVGLFGRGSTEFVLVSNVKELCIQRWGSLEKMEKEKEKRGKKNIRNIPGSIQKAGILPSFIPIAAYVY
eukprot:Pgem_evm1s6043